MNLMNIVKEPNKILRKKLAKVNEITVEIRRLISNMKKIMAEAKGVGLAANQVGKDLQIFVIDENLAEEFGVPGVYINPEITEHSKEEGEMEEGCLSLPGYWRQVKRAKKIKIKALDEKGAKFRLKARGFLARILQHEADHLSGRLISDFVE